MTSYAGENTAKQREADRHDAQARKNRGRGAVSQNRAVAADPKEARQYVPKHHSGDFAAVTIEALDAWLRSDQERAERAGYPSPVGITAFQFRWFIEYGILPGASDDDSRALLLKNGAKPTPVRVIIGSNGGLNGTGIEITKDGFRLVGGGVPGLPVYSVSVPISPLFALRFKWDNTSMRMLVG